MRNAIQTIIKTTLFIVIYCSLNTVFAQAPEKMSYQAVIRDGSNTLVINQPIGMQVSILQGSSNGTEVFRELFNPNPQTNINGLVTVEIGTGIPLTGTFAGIDWSNGPYFIKTETDPTGGTNYTIVGTSQLLSAPYALYAKTSGAPGWALQGNTGTDTSTDFIGTTDDTDIVFKRNNNKAGEISTQNTGFGNMAFNSNTTGTNNTAFGNEALSINTTGFNNAANGAGALSSNTIGKANTANGNAALLSNVNGYDNTAIGNFALLSNTSGYYNVAVGSEALNTNTTGNSNVATGFGSLNFNSTGIQNTAIGTSSLASNTVADNNTAVGFQSLFLNSTGHTNTANGVQTLYNNSNGTDNVANGYQALYNNTTGIRNTASGNQALFSNTIGDTNTANGYIALFSNSTGYRNTSIGRAALYSNTTGYDNTASGVSALFSNVTGQYNTAIGSSALGNISSSSNNIGLGYNAQVPNSEASNQVRIGNTSITYAGTQVAWSVTSDSRWKENIQESNLGLNFITDLKPVFYTRKNDDTKKVEYGIIAQELEASLLKFGADTNGIITKDDEGMYSVRYNDLLAPMIKAIQEQQVMIETLKAEIQELKSRE